VLAAAGLIALEQMPLRLHEDHVNARMIAEAVAQIPDVEIDLDAVQTNIVIFRLRNRTSSDLVAGMKAKGVLISSVGPQAVRLVTHYDADSAACRQAVQTLNEELGVASQTASSLT
jgi:threonine aldolase